MIFGVQVFWPNFSIEEMSSLDIDAIRSLENAENASHYIESVTILLKILDNIIREPTNEKYRSIRLENKIIKEKLLSLNGMRGLLERIGFVEVRIMNNPLSYSVQVAYVSFSL